MTFNATKLTTRITIGSSLLALLFLLFAVAAPAPASAQAQSNILQGRVLSYTAGPVVGAAITLYSLPEHTVAGQTTTDENGNFVIDTGNGTFALAATAPGYQTEEQTVFVTSYDSGILFLLREEADTAPRPSASTVSGKVQNPEGVPLGGIRITVYDRAQGDSSQPRTIINATSTDADGNYSVGVPAGTVWLGLLTSSVWGYDYTPIQVQAGVPVTDIIFVPQVRVLPRQLFPTATAAPALPTATATATPVSNVAPGMPRTGAEGGTDFAWWLLPLSAMVLLGLVARSASRRTPSRPRVRF